MKKYAEAEIVAGCQRGDRHFQEQLYQQYGGRMMAICRRYIKEVEDAQDVFQDAFIKVFTHLGKFDLKSGTSFEGWMRRIFVNESINHYQKNKKLKFGKEDIDNYECFFPEAPKILAQMAAEEIEKLIENLPLGAKTVFNLFAVEGYSHQEIAEKLAISEGTSKSQLNRAKALLKEKLLKTTV